MDVLIKSYVRTRSGANLGQKLQNPSPVYLEAGQNINAKDAHARRTDAAS